MKSPAAKSDAAIALRPDFAKRLAIIAPIVFGEMSLMPKLQNILVASAAIVAAAMAIPVLAHAHDGKAADANLTTVVLADGRVAQARNAAPRAPQVVVVSPFALMNRMAADMDRQMAAQMSAMRRGARSAPSARSAQTVSGGAAPSGVCMQSVEVTQVAGQEPRVVRRSSGNCAAPSAAPPAAPQPAPRVAPAPQSIPRDSI